MIARVFDLQGISVRQIAIPFARLPSVTTSEKLAEVLPRFRDIAANILPVWSADTRQRRVAGFLEAKRIIYQADLNWEDRVEKHLSPALYVDDDARVQDALRRMQRTGKRMAVVLSRDRREIGLITLEEILKVIFGEVRL
jgi:CBS domain containing-hemolysin-like protein